MTTNDELMSAAGNADFNGISAALDKGADPNYKGSNSTSPISILASHLKDSGENLEVCKCIDLLIKNGATVNNFERALFHGFSIPKETVQLINQGFCRGLMVAKTSPLEWIFRKLGNSKEFSR